MVSRSKKPTTTRTGRTLKLVGMTASIAGRYAKNKIRDSLSGNSDEEKQAKKSEEYTKIAENIVSTLGDLKGAVMKVGQIASQTQDLLPKEISEALQKLQKEAPPVEFSVIRKQVESNLGATIEELFESFDSDPYASASIGQVHRARTKNGMEVVVKVQYPAVSKSVDSDLSQLKLALKLGGLLKLPKESVDALFKEINARLKEELDYVNEALNVSRFKAFHERHEGILIPEVVQSLSTDQVLTMEYMPGQSLSQVKESELNQDEIDAFGCKLFELVAEQLFVFGQIHGDPHPGNFAMSPQGELIVYDFGCVKQLKPDIVEAYKSAIRASIDEDYEAVDKALMTLGARVESQESPGADYYKIWRNIFFEPFLERAPYDYAKSDIHIRAAKNTSLFFQHMKRFKPPIESLYIDRMISGQFWIMKSLGVKADFRSLLDEYLQ